MPVMHHHDDDCAPYLPADDGATMRECPICGVHHDEPCPRCGGTGFHRVLRCGHECLESDTRTGDGCANPACTGLRATETNATRRQYGRMGNATKTHRVSRKPTIK